jgi:hypothetical protein
MNPFGAPACFAPSAHLMPRFRTRRTYPSRLVRSGTCRILLGAGPGVTVATTTLSTREKERDPDSVGGGAHHPCRGIAAPEHSPRRYGCFDNPTRRRARVRDRPRRRQGNTAFAGTLFPLPVTPKKTHGHWIQVIKRAQKQTYGSMFLHAACSPRTLHRLCYCSALWEGSRSRCQ